MEHNSMSSSGLKRRKLFCPDSIAAAIEDIINTIVSTPIAVKPCHVCRQAEVQPEVRALQLPTEGSHGCRRGEATKKGIGLF